MASGKVVAASLVNSESTNTNREAAISRGLSLVSFNGQQQGEQEQKCQQKVREVGDVVGNPSGHRVKAPEGGGREDRRGAGKHPPRQEVKEQRVGKVENKRNPMVGVRIHSQAWLEERDEPQVQRPIVLFRGGRQQELPELLPCLRRVDHVEEAVVGKKLAESAGKDPDLDQQEQGQSLLSGFAGSRTGGGSLWTVPLFRRRLFTNAMPFRASPLGAQPS